PGGGSRPAVPGDQPDREQPERNERQKELEAKVLGRHVKRVEPPLKEQVADDDQHEDDDGGKSGSLRASLLHDSLDAEGREHRQSERRHENQPLVQGDVEERQLADDVADDRETAPEGETEESDHDKEPLDPSARKEADRRERKENRADVSD